jgi:hypothetical protein
LPVQLCEVTRRQDEATQLVNYLCKDWRLRQHQILPIIGLLPQG